MISPLRAPNPLSVAFVRAAHAIGLDGSSDYNGGPYAGLDRFEARKKLWVDMREAGLVIKEQPHTLNVPRSQRGGDEAAGRYAHVGVGFQSCRIAIRRAHALDEPP